MGAGRANVDALDAAFYATFGNVAAAGWRTLVALDVSGSVSRGEVRRRAGADPRVAPSAMALVTLASEPAVEVVAFCNTLVPLALSPRQRPDDVCGQTERMPFGGTDCAQPMLWATQNGCSFDTFVVYTDSETWAGPVHPAQALVAHRERTGIPRGWRWSGWSRTSSRSPTRATPACSTWSGSTRARRR